MVCCPRDCQLDAEKGGRRETLRDRRLAPRSRAGRGRAIRTGRTYDPTPNIALEEQFAGLWLPRRRLRRVMQEGTLLLSARVLRVDTRDTGPPARLSWWIRRVARGAGFARTKAIPVRPPLIAVRLADPRRTLASVARHRPTLLPLRLECARYGQRRETRPYRHDGAVYRGRPVGHYGGLAQDADARWRQGGTQTNETPVATGT